LTATGALASPALGATVVTGFLSEVGAVVGFLSEDGAGVVALVVGAGVTGFYTVFNLGSDVYLAIV